MVPQKLELAQRLMGGANAVEERITCANELREGLEVVFTQDYCNYLQAFFKPFCEVLRNVPPQLTDSPQHKLRNIVLDIISRLPQTDVFRPYVQETSDICMAVMQTDNQDNAIIAIKVAFDLQKTYKGSLEKHAGLLLDFACKMYSEFNATVKEFLLEPQLAASGEPLLSTMGSPSVSSVKSFKVIMEFPLIIMFLFQMYPPASVSAKFLPILLPKLLEATAVAGPSVDSLHPSLVTPYYNDFRISQVKTMSFIMFLLRHHPEVMRPHSQVTADSLVQLLKSCPDSVPARKELLLAMRHMMNTHRDVFRTKLDDMLDDSHILLGSGRACVEALRPLGCTILAELLHSMRKTLSVQQLCKAVYAFSAITYDSSLPVAVHSTCVRLLINLVEIIHPMARSINLDGSSKCKVRQLLTHVLEILLTKVKHLKGQATTLLEQAKAEKAEAEAQRAAVSTGAALTDAVAMTAAAGGAPVPEPGKAMLISFLVTPGDKEKEAQDCKSMLALIVSGMKNLVYSLLNFQRNAVTVLQQQGLQQGLPQPPLLMPAGITEEEIRMISRFWSYGLRCLKLAAYTGEAKEPYESFSDVFISLEGNDFVEVISNRMEDMFQGLVSDPEIMHVVAHMLSNPSTGGKFLVLLASFLVDKKLPLLSNITVVEGAMTLKLFKLFFAAFGNYVDMEPVILPLLVKMMRQVLRLVVEAKQVHGYLQLMRSFFKMVLIAGPKTKNLYTELLPFQQPTMNLILEMLAGPTGAEMRTLLLELSLTLPAQLSQLLPTLPKLMKPLVQALQGPEEVTLIGLRTLEVWVDSLNPEFLEPAMSEVVHELMTALWALLKPSSALATKALIMLGKLGGRNRRFLHDHPQRLEYRDNHEHGLRLILAFKPNTSFPVPFDRCIALTRQGIFSPTTLGSGDASNDLHYRQQALKFLHTCMATVLNLSPLPGGELDQTVAQLLQSFLGEDQPTPQILPMKGRAESGVKTKTQLVAERQAVVSLISTVIGASADERLASVATPFAHNVCRHFAMLYCAGAVSPPPAPAMSKPPMSSQQSSSASPMEPLPHGLRELDVHLFLDALIQVMCDKVGARSKAGLEALSVFVETILTLHEARTQSQAGKARELDAGEKKEEEEKLKEAAAANGGREVEAGAGDGAEPMQLDLSAPKGVKDEGEKAEGDKAKADASKDESSKKPSGSERDRDVAASLGLPLVLDDLYPRILHCCCEDYWQARLAGASAIKLLLEKLPDKFVRHWGASSLRALMTVLRLLPEHSVAEKELVDATIDFLMRKCLYGDVALDTDSLADDPTKDLLMASSLLPFQPKPLAPPAPEPLPKAPNTTFLDLSSPSNRSPLIDSAGVVPPLVLDSPNQKKPLPTPPDVPAVTKPSHPLLVDDAWVASLVDYLVVSCVVNQFSPSRMRSSAVRCITILSNATGTSISALIKPPLSTLNPPLQTRRLLPSKSMEHAIGLVEALTFCFKQQPAPVPLTADTLEAVKEALQLADREETSLAPRLLATAAKGTTMENLTRLRVSCMGLLCAALSWEEFRDNLDTNQQMREQLTAMFFKNLTAANEDVYSASKTGLSLIVQNQKPPIKNLLQGSLRPLLYNLATYQKLTISMLQGLARLLELLSDWFNQTLGEKLLEHLQRWLDPETLLKGQVAWNPGEEPVVAALIMDLFHLLPRMASKFLETHGERPGLVVLTIELEEKLSALPGLVPLPHVLSSPYRVPLTRFLNKYSSEAVSYFLEPQRLSNQSYLHRLLHIIQSPEGRPFLEQLAKESEDKLINVLIPTNSPNDGPPTALTPSLLLSAPAADSPTPYHAVHLVCVLSKLLPSWLSTHPRLLGVLMQRWRSTMRLQRIRDEELLTRSQLLESKRLAKCVISYVHMHRAAEASLLFELFTIYSVKSIVDFSFLEHYCRKVVVNEYSLEEKKALLESFVHVFKVSLAKPKTSTDQEPAATSSNLRLSQQELEKVIQLLITPILTFSLEKGQLCLLDAKLIDAFVVEMLDPADEGSSKLQNESLRVEMLSLGTLLMKHGAAELLSNHRKELIKFGWNYLKKEDSLTKSHAFLNVAYFLKVFPTPEKIVHQVFFALLKTCQLDTKRPLIREALDVLLPILVHGSGTLDSASSLTITSSVAPPTSSSVRLPIWVRYMKRVLMDESQSILHLQHIWHLVLRHSHHFYTLRREFVPQMIQSITRLGLPNSASVEHRRLALDLSALVIQWEKRRRAVEERAATAAGVVKMEDVPSAGAAAADGSTAEKAKEGRQGSEAPEAEAGKATDMMAGRGNRGVSPMQVDGSNEGPTAEPAPAPAASLAAAPAPPLEDGFRLSVGMEDTVINFLMRLVVLLGDAKDEEKQTQHQYALQLTAEAVRLWPTASVKLNYDKMLVNQAAQPGLLPALISGLANMKHLLQAQQAHVASSSVPPEKPLPPFVMAPQILTLVEPCFSVRNISAPIVKDLGAVVKALYCLAGARAVPASSSTPPEGGEAVKMELDGPEPKSNEYAAVFTSIEEILSRHLQMAALDNTSFSGNPPVLMGLCCSLTVLEQLEDVAPPTYLATFVSAAVKTLNKAAREAAAQAAAQQQQGGSMGRRHQAANSSEAPEYGTLSYAMCACLRLCAPRILHSYEYRKSVLSTMIGLLAGHHTRYLEPSLFLEMLRIVGRWLVDPYPHQRGSLTSKEGILLCQRLGTLDKFGLFEGPLSALWEKTFLSLIRQLCTSPALAQDLRDEAFAKVERLFMMGLRSNNPDTRKQFFELYDTSIPASLFDRMQFIIITHDWEAMASQYWLKKALDLLLSCLCVDEKIMLAPNSAQLPPLLAGINQNIFKAKMLDKSASRAGVKVEEVKTEVKAEAVKMEMDGAAKSGDSSKEGLATTVKLEGGDGAVKKTGSVIDLDSKAQVSGEAGKSSTTGGDATEATVKAGAATASAAQGAGTSGGGNADASTSGNSSSPSLSEVKARYAPSEAVMQLVEGHAAFLEESGKWTVRDLAESLREFCQVDGQACHHLWIVVFPIIWSALEKQQQVALAKPIIALLSKEFHQKQANLSPNVIQALMEGISLSQPQPKIPSELIKYLGKTFSAWHIAIPLLESHVNIFPDETRCFDSLVELYRCVGEQDVVYGLWRKRFPTESTRLSLSLMQTGQWERAEEILGEATRNAQLQAIPVPRGEAAMWIDQWVYCAKQLNQWDSLLEYARSTENHELAVDCLWRQSEWADLKDTLQTKAQLEETYQVTMIKSCLALQEGDVQASETRSSLAMQTALMKWWQLPDSGPTLQLLQSFQQLVELQESARIFVYLAQATNGLACRTDNAFTDLEDIMKTWRLRSPNEWESLLHWQDIIIWRNHVYDFVINAFRNMAELDPMMHQLGYKDKAWAVNKLGALATLHGCTDTCLGILNNLYGYNAMEVQEAFAKIREQARAYLDSRHPSEMCAGLNLLNTTNLDYFQSHHQAEIWRLKGCFLASLEPENPHAAHSAFSTSLCLWKACPEAWVSWGQHCDKQYDAAVLLQAHHQAGPGTTSAATWLEYAVYCYIQGIRLGSAQARTYVPRLLMLLSFDNDSGIVGIQLDRATDIPAWVWFNWIPQLLASLQRSEAAHVKPILARLAITFPQSLYYSLRTYLLNLRDNAQRAMSELARAKQAAAAATERGEKPREPPVGQDAGRQADVSAFECGKEVMEVLRSKHSALGLVLEQMLQEVGSRFLPRPEERLLAVVNALLHRCYKVPFSNQAEVPGLLKKELAGVCKACFSNESSSSGGRSRVHKDMREAFVRDMNPDGPTFPATLGHLSEQLKTWRGRLQSELEERMPPCLRLEEECRSLADLALVDIEMPGQYFSGAEVTSDRLVMLESIGSNVGVVRRHSTSYRRLMLYGSDGRVRYMLVQTGQNWAQGTTDERIIQLQRSLNRLLDAHPQSRSRNLQWYTPLIIPVWPQVRLLEEDPSFCSYGEAYEINCARFGRESDMPIVHFKKRCAGPGGAVLTDQSSGQLRLSAFQEICDKIVIENVFSQYMYKTIPNCSQLWVFKKNLCIQMALSGLLCHMLLVGGRSPNKILFAKDTGRVFQTDFMPVYNERGMLEKIEYVPFRLTRNLVFFFTTFGVDGVFVSAMVNAAMAILQKDGNAQHVLSMFFRDDIMAWAARRMGKSGSSTAMKNETLKTLVGSNVKKTVDRVRILIPTASQDEAAPMQGGSKDISDLLEQATSHANLCRMEATWHPWF